jgi:hypothetical protein
MSLDENIKKWVENDTLLRQYTEKIKLLRENKTNIEERIQENISSYSKKPIIKISDGILKFNTVNVQQPLSYKLIESSLNNIIKNKHQIDTIIEAIKTNRTIRQCNTIKRYYR